MIRKYTGNYFYLINCLSSLQIAIKLNPYNYWPWEQKAKVFHTLGRLEEEMNW